jgi:hypothetical protein
VNPAQTHHPFGDPAATSYHHDERMLAELRRRATQPSLAAPGGALAPISGEISRGERGRGWLVFALGVYASVMAAAVGLAVAL